MTGIHFSIWATLILFGAAQGLFLATYLFTKPENRSANKWLALLLSVVSLHLVEYAADITGVTLHYPVFIAITYPLLFCMGPLYWLYSCSLTHGAHKTSFRTVLHFLPPLIVLLLMLPFYSMPGEAKTDLISGMSAGGIMKIPAGQLVFMGIHVIQTVAYIFAAWKIIRKKEEELKDFSSDTLVVKKLSWLTVFSRYFSVYFLLYFILVVLLSFINSYQAELDYLLLLIMAMSMYAIGFSAINSPEIFNVIPVSDLQSQASDRKAKVYSQESAQRFPGLKEQLLQYMDAGKPWLKCDLKISELAEALGVPAYQLSQVINEEFGVNFYDFVNKYRVDEAKKLLVGDTRGYKILAIAYEVGFNSKATFNRVFKNVTGLTPSEYRDQFTPEAGNPVSPQA